MKKSETLRIAIVGATGLVGRTFLKVLENSFIPIAKLDLFATSRSAGTSIVFKNKELIVQDIKNINFANYDVALFSAGKDASKEFAPLAVMNGTLVIDNGSYWRMHPQVPLVVPEVNFEDAFNHKGIIANPNCSTIQLVVALQPIENKFKIKKVEVSTYQAISGAGQKGINKLLREIETGVPVDTLSKHPIAFNINFHTIQSKFGFSEEEIKIINETRKILHRKNLKISATCVRIPVLVGHSEAVSVITKNEFSLEEVEEVWRQSPGIIIMDDPQNEEYPTPKMVEGTDSVYIGRIRRNPAEKNGLMFWVVADNVRKGAATNAIQILEHLLKVAPERIFSFQKMFK
ncbi:aspartate-semialdehyde dehydrogenase [Bacteroidetes/Chlorobi group bacterium Naka2016]|jgi:aspartate-semialdehyde dehydrogenase|nr:MAG: aspartate-semialdehyde dehydrogenase [Bacteroidetes/Chlorobi group bacterium Naka2016]